MELMKQTLNTQRLFRSVVLVLFSIMASQKFFSGNIGIAFSFDVVVIILNTILLSFEAPKESDSK